MQEKCFLVCSFYGGVCHRAYLMKSSPFQRLWPKKKRIPHDAEMKTIHDFASLNGRWLKTWILFSFDLILYLENSKASIKCPWNQFLREAILPIYEPFPLVLVRNSLFSKRSGTGMISHYHVYIQLRSLLRNANLLFALPGKNSY